MSMKELKEDLKKILKDMQEIVRAKFKPMMEKVNELDPELSKTITDVTEMSITHFFLEQAIEHWVDEE